jgi:hypothetical protein
VAGFMVGRAFVSAFPAIHCTSCVTGNHGFYAFRAFFTFCSKGLRKEIDNRWPTVVRLPSCSASEHLGNGLNDYGSNVAYVISDSHFQFWQNGFQFTLSLGGDGPISE